MTTPATLISELMHNAAVSGNQTLERRLADTAVWFHHHKHDIARDNLAARQAFLEKAMWIMLEIEALMLERIRSSNKNALWLPTGMLHDGADMKSFR